MKRMTMLALLATMALADTIELKTGEKIEGTLKQSGSNETAIEIGGQVITFTLDKVRAIYPGTAPTESEHIYRTAETGIIAPRVLYKTDPSYTPEAKAAEIEGDVVLSFYVGPDGVAHSIRLVRGIAPGLDEKAIEAVGQWRFEPGTKDGAPVAVAATVQVRFRLIRDAQVSNHPKLERAAGIVGDIASRFYLSNTCPQIRSKPLFAWTAGDMQVWQSCTASGFFIGNLYVYTAK